jgi:hypothetical protein
MRLQIVQKQLPFSHTPGMCLVLPGSVYGLQIFPTLVRFFDLSQAQTPIVGQLKLDLKGPIEGFTIQQNLEIGKITVWGQTACGFVRYHLASQLVGQGVRLLVEKTPQPGLHLSLDNKDICLVPPKSECLLFCQTLPFSSYIAPSTERLSLGSHKAQDWDLVRRRCDLKEILPTWSRLGHLIPPCHEEKMPPLLQSCKAIIDERKIEAIVPALKLLFQSGFSDLLLPRLFDDHYQGIIDSPSLDASPLILLSQGTHLIRSLFLQVVGNDMHFLPALPPEFAAGRFINLDVQGGQVCLEWTKKTIRRVIFKATQNQEWHCHFKKVRQFRMRQNLQGKGQIIKTGTALILEKNCHYYFDNFN